MKTVCRARGDLYALFIEAYFKILMVECPSGQKRDPRGNSQELAWGRLVEKVHAL